MGKMAKNWASSKNRNQTCANCAGPVFLSLPQSSTIYRWTETKLKRSAELLSMEMIVKWDNCSIRSVFIFGSPQNYKCDKSIRRIEEIGIKWPCTQIIIWICVLNDISRPVQLAQKSFSFKSSRNYRKRVDKNSCVRDCGHTKNAIPALALWIIKNYSIDMYEYM